MSEFLENYKSFYERSFLTDFKVIVKDKTFHLHKLVLAAQNSVFCDLISKNLGLNKIEIDLEPTAFEIFIKYLYVGELEDKDMIVPNNDLLEVAKKYEVNELKNFCDSALTLKVNKENAIENLIRAIEFDCQKLKEKACETIANHYQTLKESDGFKELLSNIEAISSVLKILEKPTVSKFICHSKSDSAGFEKLFGSQVHSDLTLKIGQENFPAHKSILCVRSPYFNKVLSKNLKWKIISLQAVDPAAFKVFLKFLYTHQVERKDLSRTLLVIAKTYECPELIIICEHHLCMTLNVDNCCELLLLAAKHSFTNLLDASSKFIIEHYEDVVSNHNFNVVLKHVEAIQGVLHAFRCVYNQTKLKLANFSSFKKQFTLKLLPYEQLISDQFLVGNIAWRLFICKKESDAGEFDLCIALEPEQGNPAGGVQIDVSWKMNLVTQNKPETKVNEKKGRKSFPRVQKSGSEEDYYMPWLDLFNMTKTYLKEGKIKVDLEMTVETARGIKRPMDVNGSEDSIKRKKFS